MKPSTPWLAGFRQLRIALFAAAIAGSLTLLPANLQSENPLPPGGEFTLQSQQGRVSLSDLKGQVVVLYFGYTSCPSVCPVSLSMISSAFRGLTPEEQARVRIVFVSVDPERDSPKIVGNYARAFGNTAIGLTGSPEQIRETAKRYGVYYRKANLDSAMGYSVDHSSVTYVINARGRLFRLLKHGTKPLEIQEAMRDAIRSKE